MKRWMWLILLWQAVEAQGALRFNEVCYDPDGTDADKEWIEVMNTGQDPVDLEGWLLDCNGPNLSLPAISLGPGQVAVIHCNATEAQLPMGNECWFMAASLNNTHGFLGLWRSGSQTVGELVDYVEYGATGHSWEGMAIEAGIWPLGAYLPDVEQGHSLRHRGLGVGPAAWQDDAEPEPGQGSTTVEAGESQGRVSGFGLQAWPNPFNPSTSVSFQLSQTDRVRLDVLDLMGRQVKVLASGMMGPGAHDVPLGLEHQPAGPYFLRLEVGGAREVRKVLLVK